MSNASPARRVRSRSIGLGLWASAIAFLFIEGYALQDQLTIGRASMMFMLGTALLSAGICIGLFGLITAIGLAASVFLREQPPRPSQEPSGSIGPVDCDSNPRITATSPCLEEQETPPQVPLVKARRVHSYR